MPATACSYLEWRRDFEPYCSHSDFHVIPGRSPGFFVIATLEQGLFYSCVRHCIQSCRMGRVSHLHWLLSWRWRKYQFIGTQCSLVNFTLNKPALIAGITTDIRYHFVLLPRECPDPWVNELAYDRRLEIEGKQSANNENSSLEKRWKWWSERTRTLATELMLGSWQNTWCQGRRLQRRRLK